MEIFQKKKKKKGHVIILFYFKVKRVLAVILNIMYS